MTSWVLHTANTTYAVSLALDGTALVLDYFGPRTDRVPHWERPDVPPIMSTFADYAPVEYAALGLRHVHASELIVEHPDGSRGSHFSYSNHVFDQDESATHLAVSFTDPRGLEMVQHVSTVPSSDVVERWVVLRDVRRDGEPIRLARAFSGAVSLQAPSGVRLDYLAGGYAREVQPQSVELRMGTFRMGSRQGLTGHTFAPMVAATPLDATGGTDAGAGTIGISLSWSGSWVMSAEAHPNGLVRISAGLDDEGTTLLMTPGREVETPHLLAAHVIGGLPELTRVWHRHQRSAISRTTSPEHRPIVYNSWEATEFDVTEEGQLALARTAADLGVEVFVVDDGWFVGRNDGDSALGDWTPDPLAFPNGFGSFADKVISHGVRFGLWVEPEAVSPNSDLYREHPDWVYQNHGIPEILIRDQLVLDLGNPDAYAWAEAMLRRLLSDYPISFLKWDMNRPITSPGRRGDLNGFEWSFAHTSGYYRLLQMIRDEFPHVTVEGCSGGGGRIDNAVLALVDVVWASDATGPRDRLLVQDGFLTAYPAHVMSSWVTDTPGVLDRAPASLEFRFVVAMAGALGIGADIGAWTEAERATARSMVELYKEVRPVIHGGELYRHSNPTARGYALEFAGGGAHGGRIVVLAYDSTRERFGAEPVALLSITPPLRIRIDSAVMGKTYQLRSDGSLHSGAALRTSGIEIPWALAADADVLVLDPVA
ncbi:alpha-galactosidase [Microbacterium sp. P5_E9]